jgi:hypothetical protein
MIGLGFPEGDAVWVVDFVEVVNSVLGDIGKEFIGEFGIVDED